MADKKETMILDFEVDSDDAVVSIEKLTAANKALRDERKKLDLESVEGQKRAKEINKQLDDNTNIIKNNSSALEKQRMNIGDYTGALDKLVPGLGATAEGFKGVAKTALAFIATPIGAVIGALGVALGVVVAAFKKSEPVLDFFENIIRQSTAVIDSFLTNIKLVGQIIGDTFTGNFGSAAVGVKQLSGEMKIAADRAQMLLDAERDLEDQVALSTVANAAAESQIKALIVASKNKNLTFDQAKAKIQEALKLENDLTNKRIELARKEEIIKVNQIAMDKGIRQTDKETWDEYVNRLILHENLNGEQKQQIADLAAARIAASSESAAFEEKAANMIAALDEKKIADTEKKRAAEEKRLAELEKIKAREIALEEEIQKVKDLDNEKEKKRLDDSLIQLQKSIEDEKKAIVDFENEKIEIEEEAAEKTEEIEWATFGKKLEIWTLAHEKEIELAKKSIDVAASTVQNITDAFIGHYKVQENELAISLANQKTELQEAYKEEIDLLAAKFDAGEISKEEYDEKILGLNAQYQANVKAAEIEQAKAMNELKRKEFEANKKNSIAQAVADAARAIVGAMAATFGGPILKGIAAAAIATFTAIKINQIKNTEFVPTTFRQGGYTGDGDQDQIAGLTHRREFVMPAPVVAQFGKDHFQSYLDGSAIANGRAGSSGSGGGSQAPVYVSWKEFTDFKNQMDVKASIVEAA